ncbi:MAG: hypothetical protein Q8P19_00075 [bacterium]|nr:hypothetical protein [bacterium]
MIELLAVTAIIALITSIVLVNNNRFGGVVLLENLTYDVALSIRQAQVYGISVARFGSNEFVSGYGVHLAISSPGTYALFADVSSSGLYDCPVPDSPGCELVSAASIRQGYQVSSLCATPIGGAESCSEISRLDILFKRPEPDAWISRNGDSCTINNSSCMESARIVLSSPRGDTMSVVVEANGQIAVQK